MVTTNAVVLTQVVRVVLPSLCQELSPVPVGDVRGVPEIVIPSNPGRAVEGVGEPACRKRDSRRHSRGFSGHSMWALAGLAEFLDPPGQTLCEIGEPFQ